MNSSIDRQRITGESFHRKHRNLFVGLFILVPLIILPVFLLISVFKADWFAKWEYLHVSYETAGGLATNGAVTILGVKVGRIEKVSLNPAGHIDVTIKIKLPYKYYVHKDSKALLHQKTVAIGDWEIDLSQGSSGSPVAVSGDTLASEVQAPIAKTLDQVTKTVETLQKILQEILDGKGTVGRLITQDTLATLANTIGRNANGLVLRACGTLARADTVLAKAAAIGEKGKGLADSAAGIASKVGTLVTDVNHLVTTVRTASRDLPQVMSRVQSDIAEVELLLKALQNNVIIKSGINGQPDPLLNDDPLRKERGGP